MEEGELSLVTQQFKSNQNPRIGQSTNQLSLPCNNRSFMLLKKVVKRGGISLVRQLFKRTGFVPFFEQKLQGLYKDFQGHISHFSRTPFSAKKRFESMSFLVLPQHEQFYPEGLSY